MLMSNRDDLVEIQVEVIGESEFAFFVSDGTYDEWIPRSAIENVDEVSVNYEGTIFIPEWLALEKGLI